MSEAEIDIDADPLDPPMSKGLLAGAAEVDISPPDPVGVLMAGFGVGRRSLGLLEPLEAGALALRLGDEEVVLVTVDSIGLPRPTVDRIRERVRGLADPRRIIVTATHTHASPDTLGLWGPAILGLLPRASGIDPAYVDLLVERVAKAIEEARASVRPARARAATFEVPERWTRNDRKGGGRYDIATALAFDASEGDEPIATLLDFASHPEALWEHNRWLSPDYPGPWRRRGRHLREGAHLFFQGPLGAMLTPNVPAGASEDERRTYVVELGRALAELTAEALAEAPDLPIDRLEHRCELSIFPVDNWRFKLLARLGWIPSYGMGRTVETEVHHLRLGPVEVLTAPGEVAPELGHRLRALMEAPHRLLLGLACDELGYILEPEMFDDREYRYETTMSLGRATAARLHEVASTLVGAP